MTGFTSVLKKIGSTIVKGVEIGTEVLGFPFVSQLLGAIPGKLGTEIKTGIGDFNSVAGIITSAEVAGNVLGGTGTGSQKLAIAAPQVQAMVMAWAQSNLPGHSSVKDPALLQKACTEITSGFADALNAFGD